jgi:hypothetical protein
VKTKGKPKTSARRYVTQQERRMLADAVIDGKPVVIVISGVAFDGRLVEFSCRTGEALRAVVVLNRELP